jgi:hypothetical protein
MPSTDNDEKGSDDDLDIFETLTETRRNHPKRLICACIPKHQLLKV